MKLKPCPKTPNCVSSQCLDEKNYIEPLSFTGSPKDIFAKIKQTLLEFPRTKIVKEEEWFFKAESRSLIFQFIDDIDIWVDSDEKVVHFRSASRVGYSDLGVNRRRILRLKEKLSPA